MKKYEDSRPILVDLQRKLVFLGNISSTELQKISPTWVNLMPVYADYGLMQWRYLSGV